MWDEKMSSVLGQQSMLPSQLFVINISMKCTSDISHQARARMNAVTSMALFLV